MFVKEDCINIGRVVRAHGIHGQLVLASEVSLPDEITKEPFLLEIDGGLVPFYLESLKNRDHQSYLIKFDHLNSKEEAEQYINCEVYLLSLPDSGDTLPKEASLLKNYSLYDEQENFVGKIDDVLDFSGNILARLFIEKKEILLPFTEEHILDWNNEERKIKLHIPEGLLDL